MLLVEPLEKVKYCKEWIDNNFKEAYPDMGDHEAKKLKERLYQGICISYALPKGLLDQVLEKANGRVVA